MLRINGWAIPRVVGLESPDNIVGYQGLAADGVTMLRDQQGIQRTWKGAAPYLTPTDAAALRGWLRGDGDVWHFDTDLYSSKGHLATATAGSVTASGGKFSGYLDLAAGSATIPAALGSSYTVSLWAYPSSAWANVVILSNGDTYVAGVLDAGYDASWFSVDGSGNVVIAPGAVRIDEVLTLPRVASAAEIAAWYAYGSPFGSLPLLSIDGDGVDDGPITVLPELQPRRQFVGFGEDGTWHKTGQTIGFQFTQAR